jgi:hypothetical protein
MSGPSDILSGHDSRQCGAEPYRGDVLSSIIVNALHTARVNFSSSFNFSILYIAGLWNALDRNASRADRYKGLEIVKRYTRLETRRISTFHDERQGNWLCNGLIAVESSRPKG